MQVVNYLPTNSSLQKPSTPKGRDLKYTYRDKVGLKKNHVLLSQNFPFMFPYYNSY